MSVSRRSTSDQTSPCSDSDGIRPSTCWQRRTNIQSRHHAGYDNGGAMCACQALIAHPLMTYAPVVGIRSSCSSPRAFVLSGGSWWWGPRLGLYVPRDASATTAGRSTRILHAQLGKMGCHAQCLTFTIDASVQPATRSRPGGWCACVSHYRTICLGQALI